MGTPIPALETYQYTSLRPGDSTFRLLKLLKYRSPELECELFPQSLSNNEHVSYEALSYVWGSTELVECIILDRKRHWITDNLYSALQYLRLHDRDRYLWIDAICTYSSRSSIKGSRNQQPFIQHQVIFDLTFYSLAPTISNGYINISYLLPLIYYSLRCCANLLT